VLLFKKMAPNVIDFKNSAQNHMKTFFGGSSEEWSSCTKCGPKFFRTSSSKFGQKSFTPQKFACSYTYGYGLGLGVLVSVSG